METSHLAYLRRKLTHIANLLAFDKMLTKHWERDGDGELSPELEEYYRRIQPVILHLAVAYRGKEDVQAAYFAWFLAKHRMNQRMELDAEIFVDRIAQLIRFVMLLQWTSCFAAKLVNPRSLCLPF